jgi:hypothetical protein
MIKAIDAVTNNGIDLGVFDRVSNLKPGDPFRVIADPRVSRHTA